MKRGSREARGRPALRARRECRPPGQSARGDIAHNMQWRGRRAGGVVADAVSLVYAGLHESHTHNIHNSQLVAIWLSGRVGYDLKGLSLHQEINWKWQKCTWNLE